MSLIWTAQTIDRTSQGKDLADDAARGAGIGALGFAATVGVAGAPVTVPLLVAGAVMGGLYGLLTGAGKRGT